MLKKLSIILFVLFFTINSACATTPQELYYPTTSFASYELPADKFQPKLQPIATKIASLTKQASSTERNKSLRTLESTLRSELTQVNRGRYDETYFLLGQLFELLGKDNDAVTSYTHALTHRADNPMALFRRATLYRKLNKPEKALSDLREAHWRTQVGQHEILYQMALISRSLKDEPGALLFLTKASEANPSYTPALRELVASHKKVIQSTTTPAEKNQRELSALAALTTIVAQNPKDRDASLALGNLSLQRADPLLQPDTLNHVQALATPFVESSNYTDTEAVTLLVQSHLKKRDVNAAEFVLNKGLEAKPNDPAYSALKEQIRIEREAAAHSQPTS